jgi:hypothetical protein
MASDDVRANADDSDADKHRPLSRDLGFGRNRIRHLSGDPRLAPRPDHRAAARVGIGTGD